MTSGTAELTSHLEAWGREWSEVRRTVAEAIQRRSRDLILAPSVIWRIAKLTKAPKLIAIIRSSSDLVVTLREAAAHGSVFPPEKQAWEIERIRKMVGYLLQVAEELNWLYAAGMKLGWTNRIFAAASLARIKSYAEDIADNAETISLIADPTANDAFRAARLECATGDCVGMEILF